MRIVPAATSLLIVVSLSGFAQAQDAAKLKQLMNDSEICKPLKLNTETIRKLIPYKIPDIIPNADIGIDKNRHEVSSFVLNDTSAKIVGTYGCQPSDEAVPFKAPFNENPDNWRITDNFECNATISAKTINSISCKNSGEGGKLIALLTKVDDQMKAILQAAIQ